MKPYYVLLTGSKNNAGDFLIKHRAKSLFASKRPDREIIDFNAWERFDQKRLEVINGAKALLLVGGPSLRYDMYPEIYRLTGDLSDIKVPVSLMGVGWKSVTGRWKDTYSYSFSENSIQLLEKAAQSGLPVSVRDYHSLNSLFFNGFTNGIMTGCPAYYDLSSLAKSPEIPPSIQKVGFSLGVSFVKSPGMERQMKRQIIACRDHFETAEFQVLFHHSLTPSVTKAAYGGAMSEHLDKHQQFVQWLERENIAYKDISGDAQKLIETYSSVDLHIGYRVHAHIFMNSIGKLSLLFSEDGRASGSRGAIGGMVVDGYHGVRNGILAKASRKLTGWPDRFISNRYSTKDMLSMLEYEIYSGGQRTLAANSAIHQNYYQMTRYLKMLP
ncbi:polysaccharide pyruvyl transferase family protein [Marinobacter sp. 2_MG-2023]|uniref:polysaccharide pyruvyl transferase family protein n=1 Tax=Marinobacter sp. 2_MG-2023 TaxID=3062679 RepID=UPI0026E1273F|nr:polysaccharide pyruvyl transferase family protein [Marinobacter sp. 2_MG-2023]MDO6443710.1 polysaccharide pyruvyl transferase family protein [Marinobacter sp. 2_MG-2023]